MASTAQQLNTLTGNILDISRVVFFVGAGISASAGYPLWGKATKDALALARAQGLSAAALAYAEEKHVKGQYYEVFAILHAEMTEPAYRSLAVNIFGGKNQASELHRLLVRVPSRGIITTNFDECLNSACVLERGGPPIYDLQVAAASDAFFVVKAHGTILDPRTLVLTSEDWRRVETDGNFKELLALCVSTGQLVFMGYSMNDPDFNHVWGRILRERLFKSPGIYCCHQGALENSRYEQFRSRNVIPIEFQDDGSFGFIPEILNAMAARGTTVAPELTVATAVRGTAPELDKYVLLCLEFSPTHRSRLVLVTKALALEILATKKAEAIDLSSIEGEVCDILGQDSDSVRSAARVAVQELAGSEFVTVEGGSVRPNRPKIENLVHKATQFQTAELGWARAALREGADRLGVDIASGDETNVLSVLERILLASGREIAELFLFSRPQVDEVERIDAAVHGFCAEKGLGKQESLYKRAIRRMLLDAGEEHEDLLFKKLQSYFIASAYVLDPSSERLLAQYARDHWVYFDSSIILPALAVGHPSNAVYKRLLARTQALGMRLKIIRDMVNEVWANVKAAVSAFNEFARTGISVLDLLEGYITMHGSGNGNVFLEGFLHRLRLDPNLQPYAYISEIFGAPAGQLSEEKIVGIITDVLGIECDSPNPSDIDSGELSYIADAIAHLRKLGGRFKNQLLCEHEARQFYLVHLRRRQNPHLTNKIWFVTTDRFMVELQRLERGKYPLPISYTPRSWFQYLDIIDVESRGSHHFSRLQPRMRFGVVSGEIGIEAIHAILEQRRELIRRGLVTVKELAEAAVQDFHVRKAIAEYDRKAGSVAHDNPQVKEARDRIRKDIEKVVGQFVTVRTQEVEQIKSERDAAKKQITTLEKKLAKEKYKARIRSQQGAKRKKRRR